MTWQRRLLANMQSAVWRLEYLKEHPDEAERTPWPELLRLAAWDIAANVLGVVPIWRGLARDECNQARAEGRS